MRTFYGNFGVLVRALTYILSYGQEIGEVAENAVLNANYLRKKLAPFYHLKYDAPSYHEVVFDDKLQAAKGVHNIDVAKRLMDYGFHPPTMSFPLIVPGALMIEPTESEPIEELDAFADAMIAIAREAEESPELVTSAPHVTPVGRVDEALLAREASKPGSFAPVLRAPVRRLLRSPLFAHPSDPSRTTPSGRGLDSGQPGERIPPFPECCYTARLRGRGGIRVERDIPGTGLEGSSLLLATALLAAGPASAAGFSIFEAGSRATAMGGAFVAQADDLSAMFYNPAGLAKYTKKGKLKAMVGVTLIIPTSELAEGYNPYPGQGYSSKMARPVLLPAEPLRVLRPQRVRQPLLRHLVPLRPRDEVGRPGPGAAATSPSTSTSSSTRPASRSPGRSTTSSRSASAPSSASRT